MRVTAQVAIISAGVSASAGMDDSRRVMGCVMVCLFDGSNVRTTFHLTTIFNRWGENNY